MPAKKGTTKPARPAAPAGDAPVLPARSDKQLLLRLKELIEDLLDQVDAPPVDDSIEPVVADTTAPTRPAKPGKGKLAIVVGHTADAPGAFGIKPIGQSEYPWNTDLANMIAARTQADGHACHIFFRDRIGIAGAYAAAERWDPDAVVELHFNCFDGIAHGTETLRGSQPEAIEWAQCVHDSMIALYSRTGNTDRGIKKLRPGDRGHGSMSQLDTVPSTLIEPFFGDHAGDARLGHEKKKELAAALAGAFSRFMSRDTSPERAGGETVTEPEKIVKVTIPAEVRLKMGLAIVDAEARRDSAGRIAVYRLPAADGGGTYEVAGINDRYHPERARELRDLINAGKHEEAEKSAAEYILSYTDRVGSWVNDPGVEFYLRDSAFNRGPGGAAKILQLALGVAVDGGVGPITRKAIAAMEAKNDAPGFLSALREARERYERKYIGYRAIFWKGLTNRWNNALKTALTLVATSTTKRRGRR